MTTATGTASGTGADNDNQVEEIWMDSCIALAPTAKAKGQKEKEYSPIDTQVEPSRGVGA